MRKYNGFKKSIVDDKRACFAMSSHYFKVIQFHRLEILMMTLGNYITKFSFVLNHAKDLAEK